jgi:arylsulfatase A-like enzyme
MKKLNRRDFLKLASLAPGVLALSSIAQTTLLPNPQTEKPKPNVIILLFDAMSATNLSLYGYERDTTPNFKRFAERANVYHSHDSAASFTSPGTASFLTGTYPWTHRAINQGGLISRNMLGQNLFHTFDDGYTRLAYSQNLWDNYYLTQFTPKPDTILSPAAFSTISGVMDAGLEDPTAYRAYDDFLFKDGNPPPSLVFGLANALFFRKRYFAESALHTEYPKGMPRVGNYPIYFELKNIFDGILATLDLLPAPYLTYFHFWSPHDPYRPSQKFTEMFNDNWKPVKKPAHRLGNNILQSNLNTRRVNYDRYIANLDAEFGRFMDEFDEHGLFENSYIIVTSDHGEMFERGVHGHGTVTPLLYDPIIHIPLMISVPGQRARTDIYSPTNSVDVLPTLLQMTGHKIPDWCEGRLLPGLGGKEDAERSTFSMEAQTNPAFAPLKTLSLAMRKGKYKLTYYKNFQNQDSFELYDMENDPQELVDLYPTQTNAVVLKDELLAKLESVNQNYRK